MRYFLGVDGGQSSTTCLIGDERGKVLGAGTAGPCNHVGAALGRERFLSAITGSLRAALKQAGLGDEVTFAAACLGLSGGPADKDALAREAIRAEQYLVTHDALIALVGATTGRPGIVTIAGTGSIAFGRNGQGTTARAGGWGYVFGDEGGAFDIVRQALRAALREQEGWGPATALTPILLEACGAPTANALMHQFYTDVFPRAKVAALAPLVDQAAAGGDAVATQILNAAAQQLATIAGAVRRQLFADEPAHLSYIGGVFRSPVLLARFRLLAEMVGARVAPPLRGPADGALLEAYRMGGISLSD